MNRLLSNKRKHMYLAMHKLAKMLSN